MSAFCKFAFKEHERMKLSTRKISGLLFALLLSSAIGFGQQKQETEINHHRIAANAVDTAAASSSTSATRAACTTRSTRTATRAARTARTTRSRCRAARCPTQAPKQIKDQAEYNSYANAGWPKPILRPRHRLLSSPLGSSQHRRKDDASKPCSKACALVAGLAWPAALAYEFVLRLILDLLRCLPSDNGGTAAAAGCAGCPGCAALLSWFEAGLRLPGLRWWRSWLLRCRRRWRHTVMVDFCSCFCGQNDGARQQQREQQTADLSRAQLHSLVLLESKLQNADIGGLIPDAHLHIGLAASAKPLIIET